ncbi:hypothetical protein FOL46_001321 [Perkinsus olseni]|uniref:Uncharacterized protein n=1 Tax=Perkinsus olseni TaxID=32597 RepID=A0A7J6MDF5_PEROL|nr:hypothetical protein FOL46_001321 [Perkinsus olseni]
MLLSLLAVTASLVGASTPNRTASAPVQEVWRNCTASYKSRDEDFLFTYVDMAGDMYLSVARRLKYILVYRSRRRCLIDSVPPSTSSACSYFRKLRSVPPTSESRKTFSRLGLTPEYVSAVAAAVGNRSSSKAPSARWRQTIAAYESLGYEYLSSSGGAREILEQATISRNERRSAEGLDVRTEEARDTLKLPVAPLGVLTQAMSVKEQRPCFFGPTNSPEVIRGGEGLFEILERMIASNWENGIESATDTVCEAERILNTEPTQQYDYRLAIDREEEARLSLTVKSLKNPIVESS